MSKTSKTTTIIKSTANNQPKIKRARKKKKSSESSVPLARARTMETRQPSSFRTPMREEYVMSLPGTTLPLAVHQTLAINPGNPLFSKWGANIGACFESYSMDYLEIEYIPRCSANTEGFVCISPDCNPHDPVPTSEVDLYMNSKAKSDSPWKSFKVVFTKEMLSKRKTYFCRKQGQLPVGADKDLYDIGNLHLAGGGQLAGGFVGQIWIRWKATFYTPESFNPEVPSVMGANNVNVSAIKPLGEMAINTMEAVNNPLGSITSDGVGNVLTFAKDFHGFLTMTGAGSGLTGNPSITSLLGTPSINQIEDGINQNFQLLNAAGTGNALNSLITAKLGDAVRLVGGTGGTYTIGRLSLMSCGL